MQKLDYYEFLGYLAPGATFLFGISRLYPDLFASVSSSGLTLGDLGIFVVLSYVAGQTVQAIGNYVEWAWWKGWGGWPSDWPRSGRHRLISPEQVALLPSRVSALLGGESKHELKDFDAKGWPSVVSQIGAALKAANRTERLEVFNGNYGLCRGLVSGLLVLLALSLCEHGLTRWRAEIALLLLGLLMLHRMHRFGWRYARELFVQFLALPEPRP
jgi:hypothetical protein